MSFFNHERPHPVAGTYPTFGMAYTLADNQSLVGGAPPVEESLSRDDFESVSAHDNDATRVVGETEDTSGNLLDKSY